MSLQDPDDDRSGMKRPAWPSRLFQWLRAFELREQWWQLLDYFESHRKARRLLFGLFASFLLVVVMLVWVYPWWAQRNAISMARQWIAAGRLNYAAEAVQKALGKSPHEPELWMLAAELARLNGQKSMEVEYAHEAAQLQPEKSKYVLGWASAALRADMQDVAEKALASVSVRELDQSSFAQRLLGELARRKRQEEGAISHFEAALRIDGTGAINEIPLGLCLIASQNDAQRRRGLSLLEKWTADREWGAGALQILLNDAMQRNDLPAMVKRAEALRAHPRCTVGDMPNCLSALVRSDGNKYAEVILQLKQAHLASPESAAQLIGWLNQIGRSAEALEWLRSLPEENVRRPPLSVAKAEALRTTENWTALRDWTATGDWGRDLDFLRWAYGLRAQRALGQDGLAAELWRNLQSHAEANGVHALFAGSSLYSWGMVDEAEALWWLAAGQNNNLAVEALGTLARHYQVRRDAAGQYRVFNQLHDMHPRDDDVTNNFVFFAALTGNRELVVGQLARENLARHPDNQIYRATRGFVLLQNGQTDEARKLIEPLAAEVGRSSAVAFVYGLYLAKTGERDKAREILHCLDPALLTLREIALIKTALGD
jgi:tetratricopeptide (TPR) repeat protein